MVSDFPDARHFWGDNKMFGYFLGKKRYTVCWWGHQPKGRWTSKTQLDPESTWPRESQYVDTVSYTHLTLPTIYSV